MNTENVEILTIGDPHIQTNNIPEIELFMDRMEKLAVDRKPDLIVILGDVLHTHERLHTLALNKAYELVDRMRNIAKTYVLVGNHDMCLGENVPVLLRNGSTKNASEIIIGDILVGDDGLPVSVESTCTGFQKMYTVKQESFENYVVSENHILTLKCILHKRLTTCYDESGYIVNWLERCRNKYLNTVKWKILSKKFSNVRDAEIFQNSIPNTNIFDIPVKEYLSCSQKVKDSFRGYRTDKIFWEKKHTIIDPYILGMWLGNGDTSFMGFSTSDIELVLIWAEWVNKIGGKLVHVGKNNKVHKYEIVNINHLNKIEETHKPHKTHKICKICENCSIDEKSFFCFDTQELYSFLQEEKYKSFEYEINCVIKWKEQKSNVSYIPRHDENPFQHLLHIEGINGNNCIPNNYEFTDIESRIQLLSGFVDMSGITIPECGEIFISQIDNELQEKQRKSKYRGDIILDIEYPKPTNFCLLRKLQKIFASVGIHRTSYETGEFTIPFDVLPTRTTRIKGIEKAPSYSPKISNPMSQVEIVPSKEIKYFGFSVSGKNNRFLLGDFTVTHNCNNQQFLNGNHWLSGMKEWENTVIVDKVVSETIRGEKFMFIPYVPPGRFEEALDTFEGEWKDASCIFAHQEFYGCSLGAIISTEGDKWSLDYPHIISGHIHGKQRVQKNIYYTGSALQHAFGESDKNIIAHVSFKDREYELEEIDLLLPRKKIVYMDVEDLEKYEKKKTDDQIKLTLTGNYNQFKALKKTKKYKDVIEQGVKVVFKPKKLEQTNPKKQNEEVKEQEKETSKFNDVLLSIVNEQKNPYLTQAYESIVNEKEIEIDDVMFL